MDKCYTVEWNSVGGEPELVAVYKSFGRALAHCVDAIEEAKGNEEKYFAVDYPDTGYHIVAEASNSEPGVHWVELHQTSNRHMNRVIEWYKITTMEFADA
jgi:hypothetical protein